MNNIENQWDLSANQYSEHVKKYFTHRRITNLLAASCDFTPSTILDFGCGPGNSTAALSQIFLNTGLIIGIDNSRRMLDEALKDTIKNNIEYLLDDENLTHIKNKVIDAVFLSNSFFHLERKTEFLKNLKYVLTKKSRVYFSMYESVFHPENKITWSYAKEEHDLLISDAIKIINEHGYNYDNRKEDREIFTERSLSILFENSGYELQLSGIINLQRNQDERLSFLRIPAVSQEVFPDIPLDVVDKAMNKLQYNKYGIQERKVYSFTASLKNIA